MAVELWYGEIKNSATFKDALCIVLESSLN